MTSIEVFRLQAATDYILNGQNPVKYCPTRESNPGPRCLHTRSRQLHQRGNKKQAVLENYCFRVLLYLRQ